MIGVKMSLTAHCQRQLPIASTSCPARSSWPLLYKSQVHQRLRAHTAQCQGGGDIDPSPVVHDIDVFILFFCLFFLFFIFPRRVLSVVYFNIASIHPPRTKKRPTHTVELMHLCMSPKIPLTGYEISEIATKAPTKPDCRAASRQSPATSYTQYKPGHAANALSQAYTPPRGHWAAPLSQSPPSAYSPPVRSPPSPVGLPEYRYFGSVLDLHKLALGIASTQHPATRLHGCPKKAADVTLRFRSDFFDVWPNPTQHLWAALAALARLEPGCPRT